MQKMLVSVLGMLSILGVSGCTAASLSQATWRPPIEGVVRDQQAAITIARAIWFSMNPELLENLGLLGLSDGGNEEVWQAGMKATLKDGIWKVEQKDLGPDAMHGSLVVFIAQTDAHIVYMHITP